MNLKKKSDVRQLLNHREQKMLLVESKVANSLSPNSSTERRLPRIGKTATTTTSKREVMATEPSINEDSMEEDSIQVAQGINIESGESS